MITEDIVSSILAETQEKLQGIDQAALKRILEDTIGDYDVHLKEGFGKVSDLSDRINTYLDCRKLDGLSKSTLSNYKYHLDRFAKYVQKRTTTITTTDIRDYLANLMLTRRIKNSTLEGEKSILKSFFSWLEDEEYIRRNPAKKIRPTKCETRVRSSLTLEELELMRDACQTPRQRCMLELFYSTGIRLSELSGINIHDLNWSNNSIKVLGKGNKERIVYFSEKTKVYLKKYLVVRGSFESPALFIASKIPHARMGGKSIENEISVIAELANPDKHVFPHLLRHSFATQGYRSGMSLTTIQGLMGHSKVETTLGYIDTDREAAAYEHRKFMNQ